MNAVGWYTSNGESKTHPVGQKQPNGLGLYDMNGNVWEWCSDWYDENYYKSSPPTNPLGAGNGESRALRGGGWYYHPEYFRVANRSGYQHGGRGSDLGFRLAHSSR